MQPSTKLEKQLLRKLVLDVIKNNRGLQLASMPHAVADFAVRQGHLTTGSQGYVSDGLLSFDEKLHINEIVWELLTQGIIVPGSENGGTDLPFFRLTAYGQECLKQEAVLPHDYENYL